MFPTCRCEDWPMSRATYSGGNFAGKGGFGNSGDYDAENEDYREKKAEAKKLAEARALAKKLHEEAVKKHEEEVKRHEEEAAARKKKEEEEAKEHAEAVAKAKKEHAEAVAKRKAAEAAARKAAAEKKEEDAARAAAKKRAEEAAAKKKAHEEALAKQKAAAEAAAKKKQEFAAAKREAEVAPPACNWNIVDFYKPAGDGNKPPSSDNKKVLVEIVATSPEDAMKRAEALGSPIVSWNSETNKGYITTCAGGPEGLELIQWVTAHDKYGTYVELAQPGQYAGGCKVDSIPWTEKNSAKYGAWFSMIGSPGCFVGTAGWPAGIPVFTRPGKFGE